MIGVRVRVNGVRVRGIGVRVRVRPTARVPTCAAVSEALASPVLGSSPSRQRHTTAGRVTYSHAAGEAAAPAAAAAVAEAGAEAPCWRGDAPCWRRSAPTRPGSSRRSGPPCSPPTAGLSVARSAAAGSATSAATTAT